MRRAGGITMTIGGLVGRAAIGSLGLLIAVGVFVPEPAPAPSPRSRPDPDGPAHSPMTVTLRIPEGEPAGHVIVLDPSGRELATVSGWFNGDVAVLARREAGAGVNSFLKAGGEALVGVFGAARQTRIHAKPDGTPRVSVTDPRSGRIESPAPSPADPVGIGFAGKTGTR